MAAKDLKTLCLWPQYLALSQADGSGTFIQLLTITDNY